MKKVIFILSALFLFCCSHTEKPTGITSSTINGCKVIFLDQYYSAYLKAIKTDTTNKNEQYKEIIGDPIHNLYFSRDKNNFAPRKANEYDYIQDTSGIESNIFKINKNRAKVEELISSALTECNKYLKIDSITFYIAPSSNFNKEILQKMGGIDAWTTGSKEVIIIIDMNISSWKEELQDVIVHESNHAYWFKIHSKDNINWTLLNSILLEGKADSYAHLIYPEVKCPWDSALSDLEKSVLWERIKPHLDSIDYSFTSDVMFGSEIHPKEYPMWGGYTLGYTIVQSALKNNPSLTPDQLAHLPPEEILEMSDYKLQSLITKP